MIKLSPFGFRLSPLYIWLSQRDTTFGPNAIMLDENGILNSQDGIRLSQTEIVLGQVDISASLFL